ncbi:MAG: hypothetical protein NVSMB62_12460 [Acidobacteriaceae bacterium]
MIEPDVPVTVTILDVAAADVSAAMVTICEEPAARVNEDGCALTPVASPATVTAIGPLNPAVPVADMAIRCEPDPAVNARAAGDAAKVKSGDGPDDVFELQPVLPQTMLAQRTISSKERRCFLLGTSRSSHASTAALSSPQIARRLG